MDISFDTGKMEKIFSEHKSLVKKYGADRAKKIKLRLTALRAASCLGDFLPPKSDPGRCHELNRGERKWHLSMDLDHPHRLIFVPDYDERMIPEKQDGGLDWNKVTAIRILGVEDTHD